MSLIGGCSIQPELVTFSRTSTGAPQCRHVRSVPSLFIRQYGQVYVLWAGAVMAGPYSEPWWTYMDWMPTRPGPVISARYMPRRISPVLTSCWTAFICHRRVLVQEAARLDQDLLARLQGLLEHVAVAVQEQQARLVRGDEPVHVHAAAAVQHVGQALDPDERVAQRMGAGQERVLAHVDLHRRVQRQHDHLARVVPGERHPARPVRHGQDVRHPAEHPLHAAAGVQRGHRHLRFLPEHHVVLEEHRVARGQRDLGDRHDLALDLADRVGEPELGHVPQPGRLGPAGVGHQVLDVKRCTAGEAVRPADLVLGLAPLAFNPVHPDNLSGGKGQ